MDNHLETKLKKSKLVTFCSTDNDGFGQLYPDFKYDGSSRSDKSQVQVTFPAYPQNLMFYEHFEQVNNLLPTRLSFMYVGEVEYEFAEYKSVAFMDVFQRFASVKSLFHIVSQLPNCVELRIFLSDENILPAKEEAEFQLSDKEKSLYISKSLKHLRIMQHGYIDAATLNITSRLDYFLLYAFNLFPNLETFAVDGMSGKGRTWNLIDEFVKNKANLPHHNVTLGNDGKTTCERAGVCRRQAPVPPPVPYTNPLFNQEVIRNQIIRNKKADIQKNHIPSNIAISPVSLRDPRLAGSKRKSEDFKINMNKQERYKDDTEIIEVPVPPKPTPPVVHISDEDESTSTSPKRVKNESPVTEKATRIPSPPKSNTSKTSTRSHCSSSSRISATRENTSCNNSPSIGSSYQEWETSSSEDEKTNIENNKKMQDFAAVNSQVQVNADQLTAIAAQIPMSTIDLRNVLNMVQSESPSSVVEPMRNVPSEPGCATEKSEFITVKKWGYEFERPKRKR